LDYYQSGDPIIDESMMEIWIIPGIPGIPGIPAIPIICWTSDCCDSTSSLQTACHSTLNDLPLPDTERRVLLQLAIEDSILLSNVVTRVNDFIVYTVHTPQSLLLSARLDTN